MAKDTANTDERIKLVHCTWATGIGAGSGRMESYYYRFHDRSRFEVSAISMRDAGGEILEYESPIPISFTGSEHRFEKLFELFRTTDIVQFQGSFDPLVCEAARAAQVPILVEVLHNIEQGGLYPWIDATVCVSNAVHFAQKNSPRAVTIHNGVDTAEFAFARKNNPDKIVLLQVSNRNKPVFNLDQLAADLLALDSRIELWLAGHDQNRHSEDRVKFLGLCEDMAQLYQTADFMTLFSRMESFGLATIEAMSCGCLPIVSNSAGFTEIVTHGHDGWFAEAYDKSSIIETIKTAIYSDNLDSMRRAARATVESRFQAQACVRNYEALYEQLLQAKGRRRSPAPEHAEPTAEAILGDAMFHSHQQHWERFDEALRRVNEAPELFSIRTSAEMARLFARSTFTRGNINTAMRLYQKVYDSGFNSADLLHQWLEDFDTSEGWSGIQEACLEYSNTLPQANLLLAEHMLKAKAIPHAVQLMALARQRAQRSPDLYKMYSEWEEKLQVITNQQRTP